MPKEAESNPARVLVPLALVVVAIAFFGVILTSGGDDGNGGGERSATEQRRTSDGSRRQGRRRTNARNYTVKTGDTLAGIAQKTGLSVERLQELNPQLDPQALVSGQKIKLRE